MKTLKFARDSNKLKKILFTQNIADKIYENISRTQAKLNMTRKFRHLF